jgi:hypothetical protein
VAHRAGLPLVSTFYGEDVSRLGRDAIWRGRYAELFAVGARCLVVDRFDAERGATRLDDLYLELAGETA